MRARSAPVRRSERGGFVMGLVVGLLVGLALALGVALYITKAPVPFLNKVPQRTAEQDTAEIERNRTWDPNAPLGGKPPRPTDSGGRAGVGGGGPPPGIVEAVPAPLSPPPEVRAALPPAVTTSASAPAVRPPLEAASAAAARSAARDAAALLAGTAPPPATAGTPPRQAAGGADPFFYFVQAGAYTRSDDAEQQRARLAMLGQGAKVSEREQAGRTVYRVRLGPFASRDEADGVQVRLQEQRIETQIVRVERP